MSVRLTIISQIEQIAAEQNKKLAPLNNELILLESGLDSLAFAVLVARLEDALGFDPFTASDDVYYPVTLGDFINSTKMLAGDTKSLREGLNNVSDPCGRFLWSGEVTVRLGHLVRNSSLDGDLIDFIGRSVLIKTRDQLPTALALIALDGIAGRLVICPPDVRSEHLQVLVAEGGIDAIVCDSDFGEHDGLSIPLRVSTGATIKPIKHMPLNRCTTEWVLLTSGTTGVPKMVAHSLAGLAGAIKSKTPQKSAVVWGTFYDIRRYGGLQVFLRVILGGASFVISNVNETLADYIGRLSAHTVTHVLGTPSHWRRVLISPLAQAIAPRYVRLSGEIADQAILDKLHSFYPHAEIVHAYASTEAGVGFEVTDGLEGFPAEVLGAQPDGGTIKIEDGSLRIRSSRAAVRYVSREVLAIKDENGFVDTGDMVELRNGRYYFLGRKGGIINVGGLKVHPEEVEAVINRHPEVQMSHVHARNNPITGSIVIADIVLKRSSSKGEAGAVREQLKQEILRTCSGSLAQYKVPAVIRFVPALNMNAAGKLARYA